MTGLLVKCPTCRERFELELDDKGVMWGRSFRYCRLAHNGLYRRLTALVRIVFWFLFVLSVSACTDESSARAAVENEGFTDVQIDGWDPGVCSDSDTTATGFHAKNSRGKVVSGTVCCGAIFKGCTVRWGHQ